MGQQFRRDMVPRVVPCENAFRVQTVERIFDDRPAGLGSQAFTPVRSDQMHSHLHPVRISVKWTKAAATDEAIALPKEDGPILYTVNLKTLNFTFQAFPDLVRAHLSSADNESGDLWISP